MREILKGTSADAMVFMADNGDHLTGKTGLTLAVSISKNCGAFEAISPTVVERGNGWYAISLTTGDTDTAGDLVIRATSAGADPGERLVVVYEYKAAKSPDGEPLAQEATSTAIKAKTDSLTFTGNDLHATLDGEAVKLAANQPDYAPAKAGDEMALTPSYDPAKTAATAAAVAAVQAALTGKSSQVSVDAIAAGLGPLALSSDVVTLANAVNGLALGLGDLATANAVAAVNTLATFLVDLAKGRTERYTDATGSWLQVTAPGGGIILKKKLKDAADRDMAALKLTDLAVEEASAA